MSGLERSTKSWLVGTDDVREIQADPSGLLVVVRRKKLPDLAFTPSGHGVLQEEEKAK